jgi:hypothetical protein
VLCSVTRTGPANLVAKAPELKKPDTTYSTRPQRHEHTKVHEEELIFFSGLRAFVPFVFPLDYFCCSREPWSFRDFQPLGLYSVRATAVSAVMGPKSFS